MTTRISPTISGRHTAFTPKRKPLGYRRGIPAQEVRLQGYADTRRTVHRRGRLLPEIPIGQAKDLFLSLGLSALAGYEVSNKSEKLLPDGSTLLDKDCFIYGGALTLELEAYLTDRIALLVNARERALFGSDIGKFHTQVSLGLKFIIN